MDALYWLTAVAALIGVWLNIRKHVSCFVIWMFTNATWAVVDFQHGIYPQAGLQLIYFLLSIYGLLRWTRARDENVKEAQP